MDQGESSKMCKTFAINNEDVVLLSFPGAKLNPNAPRLRSNTISCHNQPVSPMDTSEEAYGEIMNNLNSMEDPDDFFGLKIAELIDIDESQEKSLALPEIKSDDEIIIEEPKKKTDLQKLCGFQSYQHVIEKAIYSSSEKMLTLNQIYTWIEENIPYFCELSRVNKSKCWKNAIRHNLSLHKQFYKVLREGHRSCLWAVDKNRIKKGEKTKKPMPILPPTFRPRSQTDPISMKPVKNFIAEQLAANSTSSEQNPSFDNLLSRMASVSSGKNSMETLPQDPVVRNDHGYSSPSSSSGSGTPWMDTPSPQNSQNGYVPSVTPWNYEMGASSDYTPNFDTFNMSPPTLELDLEAILEHERHLYNNTSFSSY